MKIIKLIPIILLLLLVSCEAIRVNSDYDKTAKFETYKTYAYNKSSIDKMTISDLDKRRILKAVDAQLTLKGFSKSETPDLVINISTKENEQIDVNRNNIGFGLGYGWNPWMIGGNFGMNINKYIEGTLLIDFIDAKQNLLIWQGEGNGTLTKNVDKKEALITDFVTKILAQYPPAFKK